jgi:hypothetical protein
MSLTDNRVIESIENQQIHKFGVDGAIQTIYNNALVAAEPTAGSGYLLVAADTANYEFRGIARQFLDQTAVVTDATNEIEVWVPGSGNVFQLPIVSSVTIKNIGDSVYVSDDEKVDLVGGVSNNVLVGTIVYIIDANNVGVRI